MRNKQTKHCRNCKIDLKLWIQSSNIQRAAQNLSVWVGNVGVWPKCEIIKIHYDNIIMIFFGVWHFLVWFWGCHCWQQCKWLPTFYPHCQLIARWVLLPGGLWIIIWILDIIWIIVIIARWVLLPGGPMQLGSSTLARILAHPTRWEAFLRPKLKNTLFSDDCPKAAANDWEHLGQKHDTIVLKLAVKGLQ